MWKLSLAGAICQCFEGISRKYKIKKKKKQDGTINTDSKLNNLPTQGTLSVYWEINNFLKEAGHLISMKTQQVFQNF